MSASNDQSRTKSLITRILNLEPGRASLDRLTVSQLRNLHDCILLQLALLARAWPGSE